MRSLTLLFATVAALLAAGCLGQQEAEESSTPAEIDVDPCTTYQVQYHWQDSPNIEQVVAAIESEEYEVRAMSEDHYIIEPVYEGVVAELFLDAREGSLDDGAGQREDGTNQTASGNETAPRDLILQIQETNASESHPGLVQGAAEDLVPIVTGAMEGEELVHQFETTEDVC